MILKAVIMIFSEIDPQQTQLLADITGPAAITHIWFGTVLHGERFY